MAKASDIRITTRRTRVCASPSGAKQGRAVKADTSRKKELFFDCFAESYFETAIWADRPEGCYAGDVWPGCIPEILADCHRFQEENRRLLECAYGLTRVDAGEGRLYDVTDAGHDFLLSRNGHGTGYLDRGLGKIGEMLHEAAQAYGGVDVLPDKIGRREWLFIE